jgi:hypothetical protein
MSASKLEEIKCPCGEIFEAELWNSINADENPELKESLTCGEINVVCCPACGQIFYAENFLLYHDTDSELIAFVYPTSFGEEASLWHAKMKSDFEKAMQDMEPENRLSYHPVLLFGLEALVDLIRDEEAEDDEAAIVEYHAKNTGFSVIRLHRSLTRQHRIPKVLPCIRKKSACSREGIIDGLQTLLQINEHLVRYREFLQKIEQDADWHLNKDYIKKIV